mmetsp:Transcript_79326/g.157135  ORF Transcript_79326/g.157135 Transcript_79326/m.157135 type:complete len:260 (-) Transcript_79326:31-810(-)
MQTFSNPLTSRLVPAVPISVIHFLKVSSETLNVTSMGAKSLDSTACLRCFASILLELPTSSRNIRSACCLNIRWLSVTLVSHRFGSSASTVVILFNSVGRMGRAPWQLASWSSGPPLPLERPHLLQHVSKGFMPLVKPGWTNLPQLNLHKGLCGLPTSSQTTCGFSVAPRAAAPGRTLAATSAGRIHLVPALECTFTAPAGIEKPSIMQSAFGAANMTPSVTQLARLLLKTSTWSPSLNACVAMSGNFCRKGPAGVLKG